MGLVFIDLEKAFDIVDHNILCKKLEVDGAQRCPMQTSYRMTEMEDR